VADATSADAATGAGVGGSLARHARVQITADAPLVFWSFLPLAAERKVTITASAVAGISPPLCVACGILPIAVAAADQTDATDFGFIAGTRYTLAFQCTGTPPPPALGGTSGVIPYLLLNRLNSSATVFTDEQSQLFRIGAGGLPGSAQQAQACFTVNAAEQIWATATPAACNLRVANNSVVSMLCGLSTRFESTLQTVCSTIPEVDSISAIFQPDSDTADLDDYTQYTGTGRRILTLPVVDVLTPAGDMTVLGFRQFFFEPNSGATNLTASDPYSRFVVMYAGSVAPVPQGSFAGCQQTAGPGKVVLHQ
jgi:hypothetical protein